MNRITSTALCLYREQCAKESREFFARITKEQPKGDLYAILTDKALRAAEDSHAAHAELNTNIANPCDCMDLEMVKMFREALGDAAELAYERAEAAVEDAALSKFHHDAYGND
jgi:hypothetical protein